MKQQTKNAQAPVTIETTQQARVEERPVSCLRIETLEERVAPNAIWGD